MDDALLLPLQAIGTFEPGNVCFFRLEVGFPRRLDYAVETEACTVKTTVKDLRAPHDVAIGAFDAVPTCPVQAIVAPRHAGIEFPVRAVLDSGHVQTVAIGIEVRVARVEFTAQDRHLVEGHPLVTTAQHDHAALLVDVAITLPMGDVERVLKPHGTRKRIVIGIVGQSADRADGEFLEVVSHCFRVRH